MAQNPRTRRGTASVLGNSLYSILIQHAASDHFYVATLPGWEGRYTPPAGMSATSAEALYNAEAMLERLIQQTMERGEEMPQPRLWEPLDA